MSSIFRSLPVLAAALLGAAFPVAAQATLFPPLNTPATAEHRPGKLIWADLFTTDPVGAEKFYCGLLGWTSTTLDQKGRSYTVFYNGGRPVAGLAPRSAKWAKRPSRWIGFYAVTDLAAALQAVAKGGGTVKAESHNFPDRGRQAIIGDLDAVPIGLLESSSGDAADDTPGQGDWNWFELYVKNPAVAAEFYRVSLGFGVGPEQNANRATKFVLSSADEPRGGIAQLPEDKAAGPSWLGVIRVTDLDQTLARVPTLGGEVLVAPHGPEDGSRFAIILDSTGGTVGLVQYHNSAEGAK